MPSAAVLYGILQFLSMHFARTLSVLPNLLVLYCVVCTYVLQALPRRPWRCLCDLCMNASGNCCHSTDKIAYAPCRDITMKTHSDHPGVIAPAAH